LPDEGPLFAFASALVLTVGVPISLEIFASAVESPVPDTLIGAPLDPGMLPCALALILTEASGALALSPTWAEALPFAPIEAVPPFPAERLPSDVVVPCTTVLPLLSVPISATALLATLALAGPVPLTRESELTAMLPDNAPPLAAACSVPLAENEPPTVLEPEDRDIDLAVSPLMPAVAVPCERELTAADPSPWTAALTPDVPLVDSEAEPGTLADELPLASMLAVPLPLTDALPSETVLLLTWVVPSLFVLIPAVLLSED
jgi:hypothetical protein